MKKNYLLLALMLMICQQGYSQLKVSGHPLVCPGDAYTYTTVHSTSQGCQYKWTVTDGIFPSSGTNTIEGPAGTMNMVDVIWNNVQATSSSSAPKGSVKVERLYCAINSPGDPLSNTLSNIIILTLNNVVPDNITGPINVNQGNAANVSYSIPKVAFPNTGITGGPATRYADSYQWIIPSGWKIGTVTSDGTTPITNQSNSIAATPHSCNGNGAKVRARAYSSCGSGYTSSWKEITITRPLPTLTFAQAPPISIVCNVTTPITVSVAAVPGATSYTWTKPSGWGGTSTTNSITLTPNASSSGSVTVKANICGIQTATLASPITRTKYNPSNPPTVSGADLLCTTNSTYSLQALPAGATATWTVSPTGLFGGSTSGSGTSASIRALNNFSTSGQGKITFTVNTSCGSFPVEREMWVGVPLYDDTILLAQPNYSPICTNESTYFNAFYNSAIPGNTESNITHYEWIPPISNSYSTGNKNQVLICNFGLEGNYTFRVRAQNACGYSGWRWVFPVVNNCYYYAVNINPNPANDYINLELMETPTGIDERKWENGSMDRLVSQNSEYSFNVLDYEVKLFDQQGSQILSLKSDQPKESIGISSLSPGMYILHIVHRDGVIKRQLKIE